MAKQKITMSMYEFSNFFWFFNFFSLLIHTFKSKNVSGVNIWSFSFLDHQNQKIIKNILVNSGYFKSKQEFSIFPLLLFVKTFVVRGGSI
jgi:hypothetical protein